MVETSSDPLRGERIKFVRTEVLKMGSQEKLAAALGNDVTRGAVGNWERGKPIALKNLRAIAELAEISLDWLAHNKGEAPSGETSDEPWTVPLVGYVGAGSAAHFYAPGELDRVDAPPKANRDTVAVQIRGDSLGTLFDTWLVFYNEVHSPVTESMIGHGLCVVGLNDERVLVKQIRRSKTPGLFHLISNTEPPILDVEIAWAAQVIDMRPR